MWRVKVTEQQCVMLAFTDIDISSDRGADQEEKHSDGNNRLENAQVCAVRGKRISCFASIKLLGSFTQLSAWTWIQEREELFRFRQL